MVSSGTPEKPNASVEATLDPSNVDDTFPSTKDEENDRDNAEEPEKYRQ